MSFNFLKQFNVLPFEGALNAQPARWKDDIEALMVLEFLVKKEYRDSKADENGV